MVEDGRDPGSVDPEAVAHAVAFILRNEADRSGPSETRIIRAALREKFGLTAKQAARIVDYAARLAAERDRLRGPDGKPVDWRLRLGVELVPRALWGRSAHKRLRRPEWEAIRRDVLDAAGRRCVICDEAPHEGLTCHELWEYDDAARVATLTGFESVCRRCSLVHHIGLTTTGRIGPRARDEAFDRLAAVNGITRREANVVFVTAMRLHAKRGVAEWQQRVRPDLVRRYPTLATIFAAAA
jgi:hypothetical protein